jgi:hypothetical protein
MLPDDVLLEIFAFYADEDMNEDFERVEEWKTLAHVCRRWRSVAFQSPRRLNLRLLCTPDSRITCKGHPGRLAASASHHSQRRSLVR